MQKKRWISLVIIVLSLALTLPIGYAVAWFTSQSNATGTIQIKPGIDIRYEGLYNNAGTYNLILNSNNTGTYSNAGPGEDINVSQVTVWQDNKGSTTDAVFRFKLTYYYCKGTPNDNSWIETSNNETLHLAENLTVTSNFIKSGDYYYYIKAGQSTVTASNLEVLGGSSSKLSIFDNLKIELDESIEPNFNIKIQIEFDALQSNENNTIAKEEWELN